jgi:hypothetical protein
MANQYKPTRSNCVGRQFPSTESLRGFKGRFEADSVRLPAIVEVNPNTMQPALASWNGRPRFMRIDSRFITENKELISKMREGVSP